MSTTTIDRPPVTTDRAQTPEPASSTCQHLLDRLTRVLAAHSISVLRVSLGLVFLVFAAFKFVSGASPAEDLATATVGKLTFGVVTGGAALLLTAG